MGYFKETIKGLSYQTLLRILTRTVGFIKFAAIARLLGPIEFGVFGIATLILALIETMTDTGIYIFLIQEKKGIEKYLSTSFMISVIRGFLISVLIGLGSFIIVKIFDIERYIYVFFCVAVLSLIKGFVNPAIIKFEKDLRFDKDLFFRGSLSVLEAILTIVLVVKYPVAVSMVIGMILASLIEVLITWVFITPKPKFIFNTQQISYIVGKGRWITLSGIFNYLYHNIDDLIVGKILGVYSLGIYQLSYKISTVPIYETGEIFGRVTLPIYTKLSQDRKRLKRAFIKVTLLITLLSLLGGLIIIIYAEPLVKIFFGTKWIAAIPLIKTLAIFGVIRSISGSIAPLFWAIEKQLYVTKIILLGLLVLLVTIFPLIKLYKINGAAYSTIFSSLITIPIIIKYIYKEFK